MGNAQPDVSERLYPGVCETLASLDLKPEDAGMARLARHLARVIDQAPASKRASVTWHLGAELRQTLAELGASPMARARVKKGDAIDLPSPVAGLRVVTS